MAEKKELLAGNEGPDPVLVKVQSITEIPESDPEHSDERGGYTFTFPIRISIIDQNKVRVANERSSLTLRPRDWGRKFYLNGKGFVSFTRNENLMAIFKLYSIDHEDQGGKFNVYELEGFKFEAVVNYDFDEPFIDWVRTFKHNGVEVPDLAPAVQEEVATVEQTKGAVKTIEPDDLPF